MPVLAGASLLAAGLVFVEQGARAGLLLFAAAALIGLSAASAFAVQQQRHAAQARGAIGGFHRGAERAVPA